MSACSVSGPVEGILDPGRRAATGRRRSAGQPPIVAQHQQGRDGLGAEPLRNPGRVVPSRPRMAVAAAQR